MITFRYANKSVKIELDGVTMIVTRDQVKPKGYENWTAVRYMTDDEDKLHCANWVRGLIARGILKPINDVSRIV